MKLVAKEATIDAEDASVVEPVVEPVVYSGARGAGGKGTKPSK